MTCIGNIESYFTNIGGKKGLQSFWTKFRYFWPQCLSWIVHTFYLAIVLMKEFRRAQKTDFSTHPIYSCSNFRITPMIFLSTTFKSGKENPIFGHYFLVSVLFLILFYSRYGKKQKKISIFNLSSYLDIKEFVKYKCVVFVIAWDLSSFS